MAGLGQYDKTANFLELVIVDRSLLPSTLESLKDPRDRTIRFSELPSQLTMSKDANWVDERVPGRSEPWKVYSESGSTLIDFTAKLVATGVQAEGLSTLTNLAMVTGGQVANRFGVDGLLARVQTVGGLMRDTVNPNRTIKSVLNERGEDAKAIVYAEVHQKVAAILALTFPQYDENNIAFPPPLVDLKYAGNFKARCVVKSVRFVYLPPWHHESGMSMNVECQLTLEEVNLVPKGFLDVRKRRFVPSLGEAGKLVTTVRTPRNLLHLARSREL